MKAVWALQDAKNKFSQVVDKAMKEGPQTVTRHGHECVVVLSTKAYRQSADRETLSAFFQNSPLCGEDLTVERSGDLPREVSL